jgi:hypothetical protein
MRTTRYRVEYYRFDGRDHIQTDAAGNDLDLRSLEIEDAREAIRDRRSARWNGAIYWTIWMFFLVAVAAIVIIGVAVAHSIGAY